MGLYGPDGKLLTTQLRHPNGRESRLHRNKAFLENWLPSVTGNVSEGHGDHNWSENPRKSIRQEDLDKARSKGIAFYVGPGQFIAADLTGKNPRVRQRRPLAERYIELVPEDDWGNS